MRCVHNIQAWTCVICCAHLAEHDTLAIFLMCSWMFFGLCISEKKLTEKYQFDVFHNAFIIMVCTVSSDWIKLARQRLASYNSSKPVSIVHVLFAQLSNVFNYTKKKNLFAYGMLWASNFSEVFWSGKVFYLIIKSYIDKLILLCNTGLDAPYTSYQTKRCHIGM